MKKRFIAGAVCPKCGVMDKILNYQDEEKNYRECVACGYKDEILIRPVIKELETRVNRTEEEMQSQTQVIQFPPKE
ncbi:YheV family putative zinc ribbon protein [Teredinibacter haidensis]|uniref:YheV family putative zinc ribbon protein n=1 Tax=Teredinibacter haidensis TaxID=2731755 RepID=UPI000948DF9E|nr:YheV family putative zinc ribbon protein [Teredinibacter haidensis]